MPLLYLAMNPADDLNDILNPVPEWFLEYFPGSKTEPPKKDDIKKLKPVKTTKDEKPNK